MVIDVLLFLLNNILLLLIISGKFMEADTGLLPHDETKCEDWLHLPLADVDDVPQTSETNVNLLQLLLDSEHARQKQVQT